MTTPWKMQAILTACALLLCSAPLCASAQDPIETAPDTLQEAVMEQGMYRLKVNDKWFSVDEYASIEICHKKAHAEALLDAAGATVFFEPADVETPVAVIVGCH